MQVIERYLHSHGVGLAVLKRSGKPAERQAALRRWGPGLMSAWSGWAVGVPHFEATTTRTTRITLSLHPSLRFRNLRSVGVLLMDQTGQVGLDLR